MTRSQLLAALIAISVSTGLSAAPAKTAVQAPTVAVKAKKQEVKKTAPVKKDDGKIKPLDPNRKVPTLKKKYKKD